MNFDIPEDIRLFLEEVDGFIEREIKPLENSDDNIRFFDHRREDARTDWERDGLPNEEWEELLAEAKRRAIAAGIFSYPFPSEHGGRDGGNLGMAIIREHLAAMGLGLHNDLQNEHSIVGNNIGLLLMLEYGTPEQQADWLPGLKSATRGFAFGITEPDHGSDATHMETVAVRDGDDWVINGVKTWNTGVHKAHSDMVMARTSGGAGDAGGITAFWCPWIRRVLRLKSTSGPSICRLTMLGFVLPMCVYLIAPSLQVKDGAYRWCSTFLMKTALGRPHPV